MATATSALTPTTKTAGFCCKKPNIQKWSLSPNTLNSSSNGGAHYGNRSLSLMIFARPATSSSAATETSKKKQKNKKKKDNEDEEDEKEKENEGISDNLNDEKEQGSSVSMMKRLDDVNPVGLGRKSRQIFDEVWRKFSGLGQISRTIRTDDEASILIREGGPMCEFAIPGAQNTTVLVVGATSRVGRVVVRKLMLRGYTVKVQLLSPFSHLCCYICADTWNRR